MSCSRHLDLDLESSGMLYTVSTFLRRKLFIFFGKVRVRNSGAGGDNN